MAAPERPATQKDMIEQIWDWAFGNGRKGVEDRLSDLESRQEDNATREDVEKVGDKIDALKRGIIGLLTAMIVALLGGVFMLVRLLLM